MMDRNRLFADNIVRVEEATSAESAMLLEQWEHPLGPCKRPFGLQHWVLLYKEKPVALAVSASTVSATIRDDAGQTYYRREILELARVARSPDDRWSIRPMVRIWRECLAPQWPHWKINLLVSYGMPGTEGSIYRFDGWTKARKTKLFIPSANSWSNQSKTDFIADGIKTLWTFQPGWSIGERLSLLPHRLNPADNKPPATIQGDLFA